MMPLALAPWLRSDVAAPKLVFSTNVSGSFPYPTDTPNPLGRTAKTPLATFSEYGSMDTPTAPLSQHNIDTGCDARSARNSHSGAQFRSAGRALVRHGNSPGRTCAALLSP